VRPGALLAAASVRTGAAYVTVLVGEGAGVLLAMKRRRINVGRGDNADIRLRGDTISRNHAQFVLEADGALRLLDIGSRNGTFVNGVSVHSEVLRDGDRVAFGGDVALDVRYGQLSPTQAANAPDAFGDNRDEQPVVSYHIARPPRPALDHTLEHYIKSVELRETRLGPTHPSVAVALDALGCVRRCVGELDLAVAAHTRALSILETIPFVSGVERAQTRVKLVRALTDAGRLTEAKEHLDVAQAAFEQGTVQPGECLDLWIARAFVDAKGSPDALESAIAKARSEVSALRPGSAFHMAKHDYLSSELDRFAVHPRPIQALL
jgi:hypothetical protein